MIHYDGFVSDIMRARFSVKPQEAPVTYTWLRERDNS
jgi:hypothetical protein